MIYTRTILILIITLVGNILNSTEQQIVIHWITAYDTLKNYYQQPIFSGFSNNGDGCLVVLGYYDDASALDPFKGNWITLTQNTRIGDSSSGYGYTSGQFGFTTVFTKNSNKVIVYPSEPARYSTTSQITITDNTPQAGQPICIRFYDSDTILPTTRYNTVFGTNWKWPAFSSGVPKNTYLVITNSSSFDTPNSTWNVGDIFEDSNYEFQTSIRAFTWTEDNTTNDNIVQDYLNMIHNLSEQNEQLTGIINDKQQSIMSHELSIINKDIEIYNLQTSVLSYEDTINMLLSKIDKLEASLEASATYGNQLTILSEQQDYEIQDLNVAIRSLQSIIDLRPVIYTTITNDDNKSFFESQSFAEYVQQNQNYNQLLKDRIQEISRQRDIYKTTIPSLDSNVTHLPVDGWVYTESLKWIYMTQATLPYYYDSLTNDWVYSTIIDDVHMIYNYFKQEWSIQE